MKVELDISKVRTKHFTLAELCASDTADRYGIDNTPNEEVVSNLLALMYCILQPARYTLGSPIIVNSGYRSAELNKKIGGAKNSQHLLGQAADITCKSEKDKKKLFSILTNFDVDQLLYETNKSGVSWIHVSYKSDGTNRNYIDNNYKA